MILFVGDTPSKTTDPLFPFKGAKCYDRLMTWLDAITYPLIVGYKIVNRTDQNFKQELLRARALDYPIVALGNNASRAIGSIPHYKLPHPSGRNRQINDDTFIQSKLKECKGYILSVLY